MHLLTRLACVFALSAAVFAQSSAPSLQFRGRPASPHAGITASPADAAAAAGAKLSLFVDVSPRPGIHVYAPGTEDYIPITVKLDPRPEITAGKVTYPKSEMLTVADERVPVFAKPFRLTQPITVAKSAKSGSKLTVNGTVDLQACDDKVCFPPESVPVSWTVEVR